MPAVTMRRVARAAAEAACAFLLLGAAAASGQTIVVGELGIIADAPFYLGIERGYFAAEKLEVRLERFRSAADVTVPLSTNQVQVGGGGPSAGLFNAFNRDWPVRIVMARTRDMPGFSSDTLLVREDLRGKVQSIADLKGLTVAVNAPFAALHYMVGKFLETERLTISDVKIVFMSWPDMGTAFTTKAIDVGAVAEPFAALNAERKTAFAFLRAADVLKDPPLEVSVILYSKGWTDARPEQARAFTRAYLKGVRDYHDAMRGGPGRAGVVDILVKHTNLKDRALYERIQWSYMDPNAELSKASLVDQQRWFTAHGAVKSPVDVERLIDTSFIDHALAQMGRVAPR